MSFFDKNLVYSFIANTRPSNLSYAVSELLEQLKIGIIQVTGFLPTTGPILLLSNHIGGLDSFVLINSIGRQDFHFVAIESYRVFGQNINQHLLPIYHADRINTKIFEYPRDLLGRNRTNHLSQSAVKSLNQKTITRAAELINQGHLVSMFPMGKYGRSQPGTKWKIGLGHLVKQIANSKTQIVFAKITGTASHDFLRFLSPFYREILFRFKKVRVSYSSPILLTKIVDKKDTALEIVQKLEHQYQSLSIDTIGIHIR